MSTSSPEMVSFSVGDRFTKIENSPPAKINGSFFVPYDDVILTASSKPVLSWAGVGIPLRKADADPDGYHVTYVPAKVGAPWIIVKSNFEGVSSKSRWAALDMKLAGVYRITRKSLDSSVAYWESVIMDRP